MSDNREKPIRDLVLAIAPEFADWDIVRADAWTIERPARELSTAEVQAKGLDYTFRHYEAGPDVIIHIGAIHLGKPK